LGNDRREWLLLWQKCNKFFWLAARRRPAATRAKIDVAATELRRLRYVRSCPNF
jgi:hypothetical protein